MPKLRIEFDMTHESLRHENRFHSIAARLRELAYRLEKNSHDTIHDGHLRAPDFIPSEVGTIRFVD